MPLFDLLNDELSAEGVHGELYLEVVTRYLDAERLPPKTRLALELLPG